MSEKRRKVFMGEGNCLHVFAIRHDDDPGILRFGHGHNEAWSGSIYRRDLLLLIEALTKEAERG